LFSFSETNRLLTITNNNTITIKKSLKS
jgi:hypothetical protein